MVSMNRRVDLVTLAFLIAFPRAASAGQGESATDLTLPQSTTTSVRSLDQLAGLSWGELEALYRSATPGNVPEGFARGRVVYPPGTPLSGVKAWSAGLLWQGKHFNSSEGMLINQWLGLRAIRARVSPGPSWLDGQPALILDYAETSWWWADVRDEMREVSPGLYVGAMYLRRCPEPQLKLLFLLEAKAPHCPRN